MLSRDRVQKAGEFRVEAQVFADSTAVQGRRLEETDIRTKRSFALLGELRAAQSIG
jgi:hypothetical protein